MNGGLVTLYTVEANQDEFGPAALTYQNIGGKIKLTLKDTNSNKGYHFLIGLGALNELQRLVSEAKEKKTSSFKIKASGTYPITIDIIGNEYILFLEEAIADILKDPDLKKV